MEIGWRSLWCEPLFRAGLLVKMALIFLCLPVIQEQWFVPFVVSVIEQPTLSPWTQFLQQGGDPLSFPYGSIMLLAHLPTVLLGWLIDLLLGVQYFAAMGFRISLLVADLFILLLLSRTFSEHLRKIVIYYWLSPLLIYITYWHGQTDIIPISFLMLGLSFLKTDRIMWSATSIAFAIVAKISMAIALPFFLIYLWNNKKLRHFTMPFVSMLCIIILLLLGPFLLTEGLQKMLLFNREIGKIYLLAVQFTDTLQLYFTPLTYLTTLYMTWHLKRMNFDLLVSTMGVAFFIIILMTPSPIGWFIWLIPFFVIHQLRSGATTTLLISGLSVLFIGYHFIYSTGANIPLFSITGTAINELTKNWLSSHVQSIWYTLITTTSLVLTVQMLRKGVQDNDYYKFSRQPLVIGISGDSGSGKDTVALALEKLFGKHSVVQISGDDYHIWDRKVPMWQTLTHLNPRANHLLQFTNNVLSLIRGKNIIARHYEHNTGLFNPSNKLESNDVIIVSGLHALYPKILCKKMDVRIYLQMDEVLRLYFKTQRDIQKRGYSKSNILEILNKRQSDAEKYIHPQMQQADIIFSLMPVNPELLEDKSMATLKFKLRVILVNGIFYQALAKILIGVCNLHVNTNINEAANQVELDIEGDVEPDDIALAAKMMIPQMNELLDLQPQWQKDMMGVMQLISLVQIDETVKDRK